MTIRRWKGRTTQQDLSHTRHRLPIKLTAVEESIILDLRRELRLTSYDIETVLNRTINPKINQSAVYRCLKRHGLNRLPSLVTPEPTKPFEEYKFGFVHIDIKYLSKLCSRPSYVFVAIERATRYVYAEIHEKRDSLTSLGFLERFLESFGYPVHTILTDNGGEFTDRFAMSKPGKPVNKPSGEHVFDRLCRKRGVEHRLIRPWRPQTNGMVERFNRRINEALSSVPKKPTGNRHFSNHAERNEFVTNFVYNYSV